MEQNSATPTLDPRTLTYLELSHVHGGIGMASTAAKPLLPVLLEVIRKYTEDHPTTSAQ